MACQSSRNEGVTSLLKVKTEMWSLLDVPASAPTASSKHSTPIAQAIMISKAHSSRTFGTLCPRRFDGFDEYEKKVAPLERRLETALRLKDAGYRVRFRLNALAPIPSWESELEDVVSRINAIGPEMLTIGALRASNATQLRRAAEANGRNGGIFDYIATQDPSGFKYRTEHNFHIGVFRKVKALLAPGIALGLCKEDASIWHDIDLGWQGCHCLHGTQDSVGTQRIQILRTAR